MKAPKVKPHAINADPRPVAPISKRRAAAIKEAIDTGFSQSVAHAEFQARAGVLLLPD